MPYAANDGVLIHFEVEGRGPALVLQHGLGDSLESWRDCGYVDALKRASRLVLVDARGHGASDKPHDAEAYAPERRAGDVIAVLDALGVERADFLGYSMGGATGLALLERSPERLRSVVLGGAQPYGESLEFLRRAVAPGPAGWVAAIEAALAGPMPEAARRRFLANDADALRACVARDREDCSRALRSAGVPVLLYAGGADPVHGAARRAAAESPDATFVSLPGLNHFEALLRADLVLPHVTRFLAGARTRERLRVATCPA